MDAKIMTETPPKANNFALPVYELPACVPVLPMLQTEPAPFDFVVPGFISGTVGGLVSPGGVGKSWFALELGMSIACADVTRHSILDIPVEKAGRVLMFAGEDPVTALHHRIRHLATFYDTAKVQEAINDNFHLMPCIGAGIDLSNSFQCQTIEKAMEGCRLVIFDTLTRFHSLDENKADDAKIIMGNMERMAQKTGASILFLHHVSKASALAGMTELQQAARGSSVFVDNARWLSFVSGMSEPEADEFGINKEQRSQYIRWNISKQNYGPPIIDRWYQRADGGVLYPARIEKTKSKKPSKNGGTF